MSPFGFLIFTIHRAFVDGSALSVQYRRHWKLILLPADEESFTRVSLSRIGRRGGGGDRYSAGRTDIQRRERRERGGEETAFLSEIGADEKKRRQKAETPEDVQSWRSRGSFHVTREPSYELPSFRCPDTLPSRYSR